MANIVIPNRSYMKNGSITTNKCYLIGNCYNIIGMKIFDTYFPFNLF